MGRLPIADCQLPIFALTILAAIGNWQSPIGNQF
jgi:hypothetical protein